MVAAEDGRSYDDGRYRKLAPGVQSIPRGIIAVLTSLTSQRGTGTRRALTERFYGSLRQDLRGDRQSSPRPTRIAQGRTSPRWNAPGGRGRSRCRPGSGTAPRRPVPDRRSHGSAIARGIVSLLGLDPAVSLPGCAASITATGRNPCLSGCRLKSAAISGGAWRPNGSREDILGA